MTFQFDPTRGTTCQPTRLRRTGVLVAALTIGLLAAGCGSGDTPDGAATDSVAAEPDTAESDTANDTVTTPAAEGSGGSEDGGDGCDLVSDELAAEILGIEIARREPHSDPTTGGVSCIKGTERANDLTQGSYVSVSVTPGGAAFFDETIAGGGTEPIQGVGDRAEFLAGAASLILAAGTDLITVQVIHGGAPGSLEDCITVAEEVIGNV